GVFSLAGIAVKQERARKALALGFFDFKDPFTPYNFGAFTAIKHYQRRSLGVRDGDGARLAHSSRFLSSPTASFRFTEPLWRLLNPIMSLTNAPQPAFPASVPGG